jgi:hypothetical protein
MDVLLDLIGQILLIFIGPSEKRINKNISALQEYKWFKDIYKDGNNKILFERNLPLRDLIGRVNIVKLKNDSAKMDEFKEKMITKFNQEKNNPNLDFYMKKL